eukprot:9575081-Alexandrium_andersonii.AAC.1
MRYGNDRPRRLNRPWGRVAERTELRDQLALEYEINPYRVFKAPEFAPLGMIMPEGCRRSIIREAEDAERYWRGEE